MSRSLNKVQLIGHLGNAPDVKYSRGGVTVVTVSIATSYVREKEGQKVELTDWHRVKFFGKLADIAAKYLDKGSMVYVEGRIHYGSYEKDGAKLYSTDIIADEMSMLSSVSAPAKQQAA